MIDSTPLEMQCSFPGSGIEKRLRHGKKEEDETNRRITFHSLASSHPFFSVMEKGDKMGDRKMETGKNQPFFPL